MMHRLISKKLCLAKYSSNGRLVEVARESARIDFGFYGLCLVLGRDARHERAFWRALNDVVVESDGRIPNYDIPIVLNQSMPCSIRTCVGNMKSSTLRCAALRAIRLYCKEASFAKSISSTAIDYFIV
jgi:hypothetical protein